MRLAGAIIALIAGIFATFAAGFTLFVGGVGGALRTDNAGLVIALGWGGVAFSFATIVLAAIGIANKGKMTGVLLIFSSLAGALLGGTFVAIFMALALIGGVLIIFGGGIPRIDNTSADAASGCRKCSTSLRSGQAFCGKCGHPVAFHVDADPEAPTGLDFASALSARSSENTSRSKRNRNWLGWIGGPILAAMIAAFGSLAVLADRSGYAALPRNTATSPSELLAAISPPQSSATGDLQELNTENWCRNTPVEKQAEDPSRMLECLRLLDPDDPFADKAISPNPLLGRLMTPSMLGATVAYLEQQIGPAYRSYGEFNIYLLDRCEIIVGIEQGNIRNVGVNNYGGECVFAVGPFLQTQSHLAPAFSLGEIFEGKFSASCLAGCGNAASPEVYVFFSGSRAENSVELLASVSVETDEVIDATNHWQNALEAQFGEDYVVMGEFQCKENLNDVAHAALSKIRPSSVRVGYDLNPAKHCQPS